MEKLTNRQKDVLDYIKEMQCDYRFVDNFYTFNLL